LQTTCLAAKTSARSLTKKPVPQPVPVRIQTDGREYRRNSAGPGSPMAKLTMLSSSSGPQWFFIVVTAGK